MSAFRNLTLLLALGAMMAPLAQSQSSSSSEANPTAAPAQQNSGAASVQARIRARRLQRRTNAIHEAYDHRYEAYSTMGYIRFTPGPTLQKVTMYAWDEGFTRFYGNRLGATIDGRGYYGTAFVEPNSTTNGVFKPSVTQFSAMAGPTYRFYLQPKYEISGRVLAGFSHGIFSNDYSANTSVAQSNGFYADSTSVAVSAALPVDYNVTPHLSVRVAPEFFYTRFGSANQPSMGFNTGFVYRFGK